MPAYKDKERGTWYASFYYVDWTGKRRLKKKRGFARAKDAKEFEAEFLRQSAGKCDMTFGALVELYLSDMSPRLKESTMATKRTCINSYILPTFAETPICDITPAAVRKWQSELLVPNLANSTARLVCAQFSAILNYACKFYNLPANPAKHAGTIRREQRKEMRFWTIDEFNRVLQNVSNPTVRLSYLILFWTGLRVGELLAITPRDIDLDARTLTVNKNLQIVNGRELVTTPKTEESNRVVPLPQKLCNEIAAYMQRVHDLQPSARLLPCSRDVLSYRLKVVCAKLGIEPIRLHDFRHSHAALLISLGTPILLVSKRLGHEDVKTTLGVYGHLYPTAAAEVAEKLDKLMF